METVLAMPPQPSPASRMPPANLRVRLKTSPLLRRMFPTRLVLRRAARRANDIFKQSPEVRRETATVMETIVAGTARSDEVAQLAQRYLVERSLDEAYTWQQWASPGTDAESAARLEETLNGDRGVVLSSCHTGPFFTSVPFFNTLGVVPFTVAGPWFFEEPSHDRWGRRLAVWQKRSGSRMILSSGSFPILSALLNRGEVVFLFFDMPGPHETRFLGKPVMLADGARAWPLRRMHWCCLCAPDGAAIASRSMSASHSIHETTPALTSCMTRSPAGMSNGYSNRPRR